MDKKANREQLFEHQAKALHAYLKTDLRYSAKFLPRPFFLEFTGSPSAGKTTTITELDKFFRRMGFRVLRPQEGAEVIRHIDRTTPLYNIRTGLHALQQLIDLSHGHAYDIVIFDRCAFDVHCWMMYWEEKNKLTAEEKRLIQKFFQLKFWINSIDVAYFMVAESKSAMRRELKIALSSKLGETTNPKTIRTLVRRYRNAYKELSPDYPQLRLLDTTRLNEKTMVERIAMDILKTLEQKSKNGH
jgi:thymidylate kinase